MKVVNNINNVINYGGTFLVNFSYLKKKKKKRSKSKNDVWNSTLLRRKKVWARKRKEQVK